MDFRQYLTPQSKNLSQNSQIKRFAKEWQLLTGHPHLKVVLRDFWQGNPVISLDQGSTLMAWGIFRYESFSQDVHDHWVLLCLFFHLSSGPFYGPQWTLFRVNPRDDSYGIFRGCSIRLILHSCLSFYSHLGNFFLILHHSREFA